MAQATRPDAQDPRGHSGPIQPTRLESVDEIRNAVKARQEPAKGDSSEDPTALFRPLHRPAMALLCILDDGRDDGEWVRLRGDHFVIGRAEGDLVIPHDDMISGRHAELTRHQEPGRCRWYLTDLNSRNGTYVRVGSALLKHGQELLIGSRHFRFDALPQVGASGSPDAAEERPAKTRGWQALSASEMAPSLVELLPQGEGQRHSLKDPENVLGRDPRTCSTVLSGDASVSPQHARLYRDQKGRWHIENARSLNGIWLRIEQMPLDGTCQFQLGEQRFQLRML
jgi:pSer/pThr/pTyr-binding forkhead associated (FHA) protein